MKRVLISSLLQAVCILILHQVLLWFMSEKNIVSSIFSPGLHLPFYALPLTFLFIIVRFYVVFLPGFILSYIAVGWFRLRKTSAEGQ